MAVQVGGARLCHELRRLLGVGGGKGGRQRRGSPAPPLFKRLRAFAARVRFSSRRWVLPKYRRYRARYGSPLKSAARPSAGGP